MLESEDHMSNLSSAFLVDFFSSSHPGFRAKRVTGSGYRVWRVKKSSSIMQMVEKWEELKISDRDLKMKVDKKGIHVEGNASYEISVEDFSKSIFASHAIRLAKSINTKNETHIFFDVSEIAKYDTILNLVQLFNSLKKVKSIWIWNHS